MTIINTIISNTIIMTIIMTTILEAITFSKIKITISTAITMTILFDF